MYFKCISFNKYRPNKLRFFCQYKYSLLKCNLKYIYEKYIKCRLKVYFLIFSLKIV